MNIGKNIIKLIIKLEKGGLIDLPNFLIAVYVISEIKTDPEDLISAVKKLQDGGGFIKKDQLLKILLTTSEPLTEKEAHFK